ncbi:MAG: class I SAM-dependent methyltransferase [Candidatus Tectomicrobia bacterium]|uniref:Class I SAM-dependent methyltransferase n=1 Tax=Tectimicrobiota bacterium TaxID=2528274 RepID=A0A932FWV3_UNCTE|nr:class I SAM-dependent methyltransferase [Candidatus Tectomicrobia bacterium]
MDSYDQWADLYDLQLPPKEDLPFYLRQAEGVRGAILELAAGTGRVSIPLVQAGHRVVALDRSWGMLERFREKLRVLPPVLQRNVQLVQGDMRAFAFRERFELILIPYNAFIHLLTQGDQLRVLRHLRGHLAPGGKGIIDLFSYDPARAALNYTYDLSVEDPATGETIHRYSLIERDMSRQQAQITHLYDIVGPNGTVRRRSVRHEIRYTFRYEMELLLEKAGLRPGAIYGDYEAGPYERDSPQMIFQVEAG